MFVKRSAAKMRFTIRQISSEPRRCFFVSLLFKAGIKGKIDLVIKARDGEHVPVDYKNAASDHSRSG